MACFRPLKAYRTIDGRIVFSDTRGALIERALSLPCGQCVGCRLARANMWAIRCIHESKQYENNCFITLTYNDANLPENGGLRHDDWQKFMKRLKERARYGGYKGKIRFYMCGEYGEQFGRPHYHACLFNYDFPDKKYKRVNRVGDKIYSSDLLDDVWNMADPGVCEIGSVTIESAGYVARYIMKKITGDAAVAYYGDRKPEYTHMSKGIGKDWFTRYHRDVFPSDFIIHDGKKVAVPRFYGDLYELNFPSAMLGVKHARLKRSTENSKEVSVWEENRDVRLRVRETVTQLRVKRLKRSDVK